MRNLETLPRPILTMEEGELVLYHHPEDVVELGDGGWIAHGKEQFEEFVFDYRGGVVQLLASPPEKLPNNIKLIYGGKAKSLVFDLDNLGFVLGSPDGSVKGHTIKRSRFNRRGLVIHPVMVKRELGIPTTQKVLRQWTV